MSNIDFSQMVTAADKAAADILARQEMSKAECRRRITAVCDPTAQINLAAAAAAGLLSAEQKATYQAGLLWVGEMRAAWRSLVEAGADIETDSHWPAVPPGVAELAAAF